MIQPNIYQIYLLSDKGSCWTRNDQPYYVGTLVVLHWIRNDKLLQNTVIDII